MAGVQSSMLRIPIFITYPVWSIGYSDVVSITNEQLYVQVISI
jgi:hypothetical protein